jgi:hypothetical protein
MLPLVDATYVTLEHQLAVAKAAAASKHAAAAAEAQLMTEHERIRAEEDSRSSAEALRLLDELSLGADATSFNDGAVASCYNYKQPVVVKQQVLVLLDFNGTLVYRDKLAQASGKDNRGRTEIGGRPADFRGSAKNNKSSYFLRPFAREFVCFLPNDPRVKVALYTSIMAKNIVPVIEQFDAVFENMSRDGTFDPVRVGGSVISTHTATHSHQHSHHSSHRTTAFTSTSSTNITQRIHVHIPNTHNYTSHSPLLATHLHDVLLNKQTPAHSLLTSKQHTSHANALHKQRNHNLITSSFSTKNTASRPGNGPLACTVVGCAHEKNKKSIFFKETDALVVTQVAVRGAPPVQ